MKKLFSFLLIVVLVSCSKDPVIYTLTATANPAEGGTVSPSSQQYDSGTVANITATPSSEYVFQSWSGSASGTSPSTTITMNSDKSVVANFVKKKYTLTLNVEGEGTITQKVIKAGVATDYNSGTIVELTAVPGGEWLFVEWKGDLTGSENPKQITIDKAKTVTAVFVKKQYPLTIEIEGEGSVTEKVIKAGVAKDYNSGTIVELTAVPTDDWEFVEWTGDITSTDNPVQITIDGAKNVKATFKRTEYILSIDFVGQGYAIVYSDNGNSTDSVTVNKKTELKYFSGSYLRIKAIPNDGWSFKSFSPLSSNPAEINFTSDFSTVISFEYTQPLVDSEGNTYNVVTIPSYDDDGNYIKDVIWTEENFRGTKSKNNNMKVYELDATTNDGRRGIFIEFDSLYKIGSTYYREETKLFKDYKEDMSAIVKTKVLTSGSIGVIAGKLDGEFMVHYRKNVSDLIIPEGWRIATHEDYKGLVNYTRKLKKEVTIGNGSHSYIMWNAWGWGYQQNRQNKTGFRALNEGYISGQTINKSGYPSNKYPYKWRNYGSRFWAASGPKSGGTFLIQQGTSPNRWYNEGYNNSDGVYIFGLGKSLTMSSGSDFHFFLYPVENASSDFIYEKDAYSIRLVKED